MGKFMTRVEKVWQEVNGSVETTRTQLAQVMASFGEDLNSRVSEQDPSQKFLGLVSTFVNGYRNALEDNKKQAAQAAKEKSGPQGSNATGDHPPTAKASEQGNLFNHFTKAQSQKTADQIVAEFKDKVKRRQQTADAK